MKKIVFLIDNLKGGGAEKSIKIITEQLSELGFKPIIILLENQMDYTISEKIIIYTLSDKKNKYNILSLLVNLIKLLKQLEPDILLAANTLPQILSLLSKPFYTKVYRIINIQIDLTKQYETRKYIFLLYSKLLKFADAYSFLSKGIYHNLHNKIPSKKTFFVPNPIDFNEIDALKVEAIEDEFKDIFQKKVFITIGRLTEQKGQNILIKAFSTIGDDANLIILGVGEKEQELKELAKKYKVENNIYFLGFHSNPFKFLYKSDVFVLSSLWEGFGNVIVEAMRCELPIISTDCPSGPREIIAPDTITQKQKIENIEIAEFGLLIPEANPFELSKGMEMLISDKELSTHYQQQSWKRSQEYDKFLITQQLITDLHLNE